MHTLRPDTRTSRIGAAARAGRRAALGALALLCASALPTALASPAQNPVQQVRQRFEELDALGDAAALREHWRAHEGLVLYAIDSYLEGGLKLLERSGASEADEQVRASYERALRGARAADEALGRTIFSDYASAFTGWNAEQRASFRAGQRAFGEANGLSKQGKHAEARARAQECIDRARPLGDWWGTAMGLSGVGAASEALGEHEQALDAWQQARLINEALGLKGEGYEATRGSARALSALDRRPRALRAIELGLAQALAFEDAAGRAELLELRAGIEERSGDAAAAARTRAEIPAAGAAK
jgi:hypothetical protein